MEATFRVDRKPDNHKKMFAGEARPVRVYNVEETTDNASYNDTILVDEHSRIVSLERVEQMGLTRFELIEREETCTEEPEINA
jgi:hypothetical protein